MKQGKFNLGPSLSKLHDCLTVYYELMKEFRHAVRSRPN